MWVIDHLRPHTDNVTEHHAHCNQLLQPAHLALQFIISASQPVSLQLNSAANAAGRGTRPQCHYRGKEYRTNQTATLNKLS